MAKTKGGAAADTHFARGFAFAVAPEDVQDGYTPPGCMSDLMHGGINDSGMWQQSGPDPYFADFEGAGDQDMTMTGRGRSHPYTEVTYARYEDTPKGARQLGPAVSDSPEPDDYRNEKWNEEYRQGPALRESPARASFTGRANAPQDTRYNEDSGGSAKRKWRK